MLQILIVMFVAALSSAGAQARALWCLYAGHLHDLAKGAPFDILGAAGYALAINSILRFEPGMTKFEIMPHLLMLAFVLE